jgi:glycosyltransferase involved in cell wall biosynthesis
LADLRLQGPFAAMNRSSSKILICALVPYPVDTAPCQRFRIEQWAPYLEEQGIFVKMAPFADRRLAQLLYRPGHSAAKAVRMAACFARRLIDIASLRRYDAVLIHRAASMVGPALIERIAAKLGRPIIFDFDDAIFKLHTTMANRHLGWLKFPGKTATICRLSQHVIVGNAYLADYARQHNPNVTIIPTSVDTERYRPANKVQSNGRLVVGWMGSSTSQTHLEMFAPMLGQMVERFGVEIRVISDRQPALPGVPHVWKRWSPETEVEDLAEFDIGIMPMPDNEWARGKCALKALQYMAMGIPALCSAVGTNCEVISHGKDGLLASSPEEFLEHLGRLIKEPGLRKKLGAAARRTVQERYSMRRCAGLFAQVARQVIRCYQRNCKNS